MQCPKCSSKLERFATLRAARLVCPNCRAALELMPRRAPLLMILLTMVPVQLSSLFRLTQFRPGPWTLASLAAGYLAAWIALIVLAVKEARRPRLRERLRPKPEIVLNLNAAVNPATPAGK
ncbi:MAG TPA: hypothetical protein VKW06_19750 [Candidatus Angelobacter sp.]|nr:hypothetical protein [Candidatus Angelobacter sp.]